MPVSGTRQVFRWVLAGQVGQHQTRLAHAAVAKHSNGNAGSGLHRAPAFAATFGSHGDSGAGADDQRSVQSCRLVVALDCAMMMYFADVRLDLITLGSEAEAVDSFSSVLSPYAEWTTVWWWLNSLAGAMSYWCAP